MDEALSEARQLQHIYSVAKVLIWGCWMGCIANSPHMVRRYIEEAESLSNEHGFSDWLGWGLIHRGWQCNAFGSPQESLLLITKGLEVLSASGAVTSTPYAYTYLAEAYGELGRPIEGLDCLVEATRIIEATKERCNEAEVYRVRGDLWILTGDRVAAGASFQRAIELAKRQGAKLFELRAATNLVRLLRDQGKHGEARELLVPIYDWFTEGFDAPDLIEAKALLQELAVQ
jgi:predicted ATPase